MRSTNLKRRKSSLYSTIEDVASIICKPVKIFLSKHKGLEPYVIGSGLASSFDRYVTVVSMTIVAMIMIGFAISAYILLRYLPLSTALLISLGITLSVILPLSLGLALSIPVTMYRNRGSILEAKFPLLASALSLLLASGTSIAKAFDVLASRYHEILRPFRVEIQLVNSLTRLGMPLHEALKLVASITPSPSVRELFESLATASKIGGDPAEIVRAAMQNYVDRYSLKVEKFVNDIGIVMESYLAISMILPLMLGGIAVLFIFLPMGFLNFDNIMFLTVFILIPTISVLSIIVIESLLSRMRV